jgi:hypothetical protein
MVVSLLGRFFTMDREESKVTLLFLVRHLDEAEALMEPQNASP